MGQMRFLVHPPERANDELAQQALLVGLDRASWQVQAAVAPGVLTLQRAGADSANLLLPWPIEGYGWLTISSASLMEREAPYLVPLELARGAVCQLRNQLADWQAIGLVVSDAARRLVGQAVELFGGAAVNQGDLEKCSALAEQAIRAVIEAGDLLVAAYVEQTALTRRRAGRAFGALGVDLGPRLLDDALARQVPTIFNTANLPLRWNDIEPSEGERTWTVPDAQIEWCRACGLQVCAGPLLVFDYAAIPDWLCLWEGDFENIVAFVTEHVRAVVDRYRGKVHVWQCAGRANTGNVLGLSEEEKLRLTAHVIELVSSLDPNAVAVVSFDQPWGEYLARRPMDVPPLHYLDALVRAELRLGGVVLEMNVGYPVGGTLPRTIFDFSRQMDIWASFGLPLWVSLAVPSDTQPDRLAARQVPMPADGWLPRLQQAWVARCLPLMLAKPYMQGVIWNTLCDTAPHDFPHAGLFDHSGQPKPALKSLAALRQVFVK